jgi:hypothetical protein
MNPESRSEWQNRNWQLRCCKVSFGLQVALSIYRGRLRFEWACGFALDARITCTNTASSRSTRCFVRAEVDVRVVLLKVILFLYTYDHCHILVSRHRYINCQHDM